MLDLNVEKVRNALGSGHEVSSLDVPVGVDEETTVGDLVPDSNQNTDEAVSNEMDKEIIESVLKTLSPKEEEIIKSRFGIGDHAPATLEAIGQRIGLSKERVRQYQTTALRKLRHPSRSNILKDCFI